MNKYVYRFLYRPYNRLRILIRFIKLGWSYESWDYAYLFPVLKGILELVYKDLKEDDMHQYSYHYANEVKECIDLLENLILMDCSVMDYIDEESGELVSYEQKMIDELFDKIRTNIRKWWS